MSLISPSGSTYEWRKLRLLVFRHYGTTCRIGSPGCTHIATHVDHIVPRAAGGSDDISNLRPSCQNCNVTRSKTSQVTAPLGQLFPTANGVPAT